MARVSLDLDDKSRFADSWRFRLAARYGHGARRT